MSSNSEASDDEHAQRGSGSQQVWDLNHGKRQNRRGTEANKSAKQQSGSPKYDRGTDRHGATDYNRRKSSVLFVPPNPKAFDIAAPMVIGRAVIGT